MLIENIIEHLHEKHIQALESHGTNVYHSHMRASKGAIVSSRFKSQARVGKSAKSHIRDCV